MLNISSWSFKPNIQLQILISRSPILPIEKFGNMLVMMSFILWLIKYLHYKEKDLVDVDHMVTE